MLCRVVAAAFRLAEHHGSSVPRPLRFLVTSSASAPSAQPAAAPEAPTIILDEALEVPMQEVPDDPEESDPLTDDRQQQQQKMKQQQKLNRS